MVVRLGSLIAIWLVSASLALGVTLNRGTSSEPNTLDPQSARGNSAAAVLYDLFVGLMTFNARGKVIPGLAESFQISEDGLTYTFRLRPGIRWSDGKPITAEDFVYSARRLVNPETAALFAAFFYPIENARAIIRGRAEPDSIGVYADDDRTVRYQLARPAPYFPQILATNAAAPVPRHIIEAVGDDWIQAQHMVTSGPYLLVDWLPQTYLRIKKNPLFFDAQNVAIDEVVFFPTQSLTTSLNRFRAGELDIILNFPPSRMEWIRENMAKELHISPSLAVYYFLINHRQPPFDDVRVRQALSISIDRKGLVEKLINTGVTPAYRLTPPALSEYSGVRVPWSEEPMAARMKLARQLLSDAGYGPANPLEFTLRVDTMEETRKIAIAMTAMWKAVGVAATIENSDMTTLNIASRAGDYTVMRYAWFAPYDDPETFLALLETGNPNNLSGYSNPEFDRLIAQGRRTLNSEKRQAVLLEAEDIAMSDFPVVPLYFYAGRRLVSGRVRGWMDNPRAANPSRFLSVAD